MTTTIEPEASGRTGRTVWALLLVIAACWGYLFLLRFEMGAMVPMDLDGMDAMGTTASQSVLAMPMTSEWTGHDVVLVWTMWAVMMAAMMLPSATPMVRAYRTTVGSGCRALRGSTPTFVAGYLLAWSGFGTLATGAQWALHRAALLDGGGAATSRWLAGAVLIGAGAYQFTSLKEACLSKCRSPLSFLLAEWRAGAVGALRMGGLHGALCIGCCGALMGLLFVLGVMNLWWIAIVATAVLIEKVTQSAAVPKIVGIGLLSWGAVTMLTEIVGLSVR